MKYWWLVGIVSFLTACTPPTSLPDLSKLDLGPVEPIRLDQAVELALVSPAAGSEDVSDLAPLNFVWSKPVLALQNHQDVSRALAKTLRFEPEHPGQWRSLGASGISFQPQEPWPSSTEFKLVVAPGFMADFDYHFTTPRLMLEGLESDDLVGKAPLKLRFNQPVELTLIRAALQLRYETADQAFDLQYGERETDAGKTERDLTVLSLTPRQPWVESGAYSLGLPVGSYAQAGSLPIKAAIEKNFTAAPKFSVSRFDGPEYHNQGLRIEFSAPVKSDVLATHIKLSPQLDADYWRQYLQDWTERSFESRSFYLAPPLGSWDPRESFVLTIEAGLEDVFGRALAADYTQKFTTILSDHFTPVYWPQNYSVFAPEVTLKPSFIYGGGVSSVMVTLNERRKTYSLESSKQVRQVWELDLAQDFPEMVDEAGKLTVGDYRLKLEVPLPGRNYPLKYEARLFVSDFSVEIKDLADDRYQIWIAPYPQASELPETFDVEVYAGNWQDEWRTQVLRGIKNGATITLPKDGLKTAVVRAGEQRGYGTTRFNEGMRPWDANISFGDWNYGQDYAGVMLTERPLYKPGDRVYYKGFVRELQLWGQNFPLKDNVTDLDLSYKLTLYDPEYNEINISEGQIEDGSFNGEVRLPTESRLGQYRLSFELTNVPEEVNLSLDAPFWLQEYRKPNFLITSDWSTGQALPEDRVEANLKAQYAFGGAIANAPLDYTVSLFGYEPCDWWCWGWREKKDLVVATGEAVLDANGEWQLPLSLRDLELGETAWEVLTLNATVQVSPAETSSTEVSIPFYRADREVVLEGVPYFFRAEAAAALAGAVKNLAGEAQASDRVKLRLLQSEWVRSERQNVDGEFRGEWEKVETELETWSTKTNDQGQFSFDFTAPETGGEYVLDFMVTDQKGRTLSLQRHFWVSSRQLDRVRENNTNKILTLYPDQDKYGIGERASVFAPNPEFTITRAHATLERGEVLKTLEFRGEDNTVSFAIEPWMAPNVYVSILLEGLDDEGNPRVKWGAANIAVTDPSRALTVAVEPTKGIYRPGDEVELQINTQVGGQGARAELAIAVVDQTLLALKARDELDILGRMIQAWPLGVTTYHSLAHFISKAEMDALLAEAAQVADRLESAFGGGGGKGDDFKPRGDFRDTAAFVAKVETDDQGRGTVNFILPDNLTTWNILAVGATERNAFGSGEANFQVTLPLLISELVPNFFLAGDEVDLGLLIVRDDSKKAAEEVTVRINLPEGLNVVGAAEQTITVKKEARVYFTVRVDEVWEPTTAEFGFAIEAAASGLKDAVVLKRPWLPPTQQTSVAELQRVEDEMVLTVASGAAALNSHLNVRVFASLADHLETLVDMARQVDYGCAEQRLSVSSAQLYQAALDKALGRTGRPIDQTSLRANRDYIEKALISGKGYGFWEGSSRPSFWVTIQVLEHASLWAENGAGFDPEHLKTAAAWVRGEMLQVCLANDWRCPSDQARNHAGYVLASRGELTVHELSTLDQYTEGLEAKLWWLLAAGMVGDLSPTFQQRYAAHLETLEQSIELQDRYALWSETKPAFFSQDERLTALGLEAWLDADRQPTLQPKVARYLAESRESRLSGNSALRVLKSLARYAEERENESVGAQFTLTAADEVLLKGRLEDLQQVQTHQQSGLIEPTELKVSTDKPVLAEFVLTDIMPAAQAEPQARGWWLEREVLALDGVETVGKNLDELALGETYLVRLRLVSASPHRQIMVESPIPSGTEAVNFELDNTDQRLAAAVDDQPDCRWGWCRPSYQHQEFRHDRARFFIDYLPAGTHEVSFLVRTRLPGEFDWLPAKVEEMYFPEVFATSAGKRVKILEE